MLPLRLLARSSFKGSSRRFGNIPSISAETDSWFSFPREKEGNNYKLNWSLVEDGVSPSGNAYRNPRTQLLFNQLGQKASDKSVQLHLNALGKFEVKEAGDNITHDKFQQLLDDVQHIISNSQNLFVEDAAVGTNQSNRIGVRVISNNAEFTLAARSLLVTIPARSINNHAKYPGWAQGQNRSSSPLSWNGTGYVPKVEDDANGERPLVVYHGLDTDEVAIQFLERNSKVIGANIVVGNKAPVSAFVEVVGYAASVMLNDRVSPFVTVPGIAITKEEKSVIIVNADETIKSALSSSGPTIYGENHVSIGVSNVAALWDGKIVSKSANISSIQCTDASILKDTPDNASWPSKSILFYNPKFSGDFDKKAALAELIKITEGKKENLLTELLESNTVALIRSPADLKNWL